VSGFIGSSVRDEGRRIARGRTSRRRASPFGSVVTGSLGLPSGLPSAATCAAGRLPRYEPVLRATSRDAAGQVFPYPTRNFAKTPYLSANTSLTEGGLRPSFEALSLHVAMQLGPYLHPDANRVSGVWPLRILIRSCLDFRWFIVSVISAIWIRPGTVRCRPVTQISTHRANPSKSSCFAERSGFSRKNGITTSSSSLRALTV
jgi:hypothetical protein